MQQGVYVHGLGCMLAEPPSSMSGCLLHVTAADSSILLRSCQVLPRSGATLTAVQGKLYLYGGQVGGEPC